MLRSLKPLVSLVICIFFIFLTTKLSSSKFLSPVRTHLNLLKQNNITGAYQLAAQEFKNVLSVDDYKDFVKEFPFLTDNKKYSFAKESFNNKAGKVKVILTSNEGVVIPVVFTLVKENRQWRIISIAINPNNS